MKLLRLGLIAFCLLAAASPWQPLRAQGRSPIQSGKIIFVGKMPENLDSWVVHDLQLWGKYRPTRESEGADLSMTAYRAEEKTKYELRHGIPKPVKVKPKKNGKPIIFTISVSDWVTGQELWSADIFNRKPKRGASVPSERHAELGFKGLSNEEAAAEVVRSFRAYVMHRDDNSGSAAISSGQSKR